MMELRSQPQSWTGHTSIRRVKGISSRHHDTGYISYYYVCDRVSEKFTSTCHNTYAGTRVGHDFYLQARKADREGMCDCPQLVLTPQPRTSNITGITPAAMIPIPQYTNTLVRTAGASF